MSAPTPRAWTDADRELVANAYHWAATRCRAENCPGAMECCSAGDLFMGGFAAVLDALAVAGWEPRCDCDGVAHDLPILRSHVRGEPGCTAHAYRGGTDG